MIMKVEEPEIKTTEPTEEQLLAARAELDLHNKHRTKTKGEKLYDWTVYQGIGWGANEVGSMAFTGMFERGKNRILGRERFEQWSEKLASAFDKVNLIEGRGKAKAFLMWASLNAVGCMVVPAIKIIDGYKAPIVEWLNHKFGNSNMTDEQVAARDKEVKTAIACEPTQSWKTLIIGRIAAMTTAIGMGTFVLGRKKKTVVSHIEFTDGNDRKIKGTMTTPGDTRSGNDWLAEKFDWAASGIAKKTGKLIGSKKLVATAEATPNYFHDTSAPAPAADKVNAFHYYAGLAGPETLGCLISSTVLEGVSKYAAKHDPRVRDKATCEEAVRGIAKKKNIEQRAANHADQIASEVSVGPRTV